MPDAHAPPAPLPGRPAPPGATPGPEGVNFALHAPRAAGAELLLFAAPDDPRPARILLLDPARHRTGGWWHALVPGCGHGQVYGWRLLAPPEPRATGKLLLDPWGRSVVGWERYDRRRAAAPGDNTDRALRSVVVDAARLGPRPAPAPPAPAREVIYELHAAAFTRGPASGVPAALRGTYAGLARRLDHLRDLGVTTLELMPVACFDPQDAPPGRTNYWGYSPLAWCAPHPGWAADRSVDGPLREFRAMADAVHRAGLRLLVDVVYNHTAEGPADGPVLSWRGLGPRTWYQHDADGALVDHTGCGNTVNANGAVARRLVVDSLCWWVEELGVDGFRFDLAAALARGADGRVLDDPPLLDALAAEPRLAGVRLVAEPWDTGGHRLVGRLDGERFGFWNDRFRDDARRFLRGDEGQVESLMARITGSRDLLPGERGGPHQVVNLVTCHDGFTLADLVSYEHKRNEANGEHNRDGSDHNLSWNSGHEGPDAPEPVLALRRRRQRNFLCLLLLSQGTPLLWSGDEWGATRRGNNNPWCQDNELNWLDWNLAGRNADLLRFTRELVAFARSVALLQTNRFWRVTGAEGPGDLGWHGQEPEKPDWRPGSRRLAYTLEDTVAPERVAVLLNADADEAPFTPPPPRLGPAWRLVVDTARPAPADIRPRDAASAVATDPLRLAGHSVVVLLDAAT